MEQQELHAVVAGQRRRNEQLAHDFTRLASCNDSVAQELRHRYQQLCVVQDDKLAAIQQQQCQAYGLCLADLEAHVCEKQRELLLRGPGARDPDVAVRLLDLERRQGAFLRGRVEEQSRMWPWLAEQQAQFEAYRQLAEIYGDELQAAAEIVGALQAETSAWEQRVSQECAAATAAASKHAASRGSSREVL